MYDEYIRDRIRAMDNEELRSVYSGSIKKVGCRLADTIRAIAEDEMQKRGI